MSGVCANQLISQGLLHGVHYRIPAINDSAHLRTALGEIQKILQIHF